MKEMPGDCTITEVNADRSAGLQPGMCVATIFFRGKAKLLSQATFELRLNVALHLAPRDHRRGDAYTFWASMAFACVAGTDSSRGA